MHLSNQTQASGHRKEEKSACFYGECWGGGDSRNKKYFLKLRSCCRSGDISWILSSLSVGVKELRKWDQEINLTRPMPFCSQYTKRNTGSKQGATVALKTGCQGDCCVEQRRFGIEEVLLRSDIWGKAVIPEEIFFSDFSLSLGMWSCYLWRRISQGSWVFFGGGRNS